MLDWLRHDVIDRGKLPLLCCLLAFLVTFLVTRIVVRYIRSHAHSTAPRKWWQPRDVHVGALHIHHVVFGVVLVMLSGVTLVAMGTDAQEPIFSIAAGAFGVGAALVLDEYASILHLADVYWEEDGRTSVDAVFAATAVTGLLVLGFHPLMFLVSLWHDTSSLLIRTGVIASLMTALPLAVVVLLKGKVWTGLTGMFFFPLLVIGAIRLSQPQAPWARWRYLRRREKMRRALQRERRLRRPVVQVKLWLQDAIAGRPQLPDSRTVEAKLDREVRMASAPTVPIMIRRPRTAWVPDRPDRPAGPARPVRPVRPAPDQQQMRAASAPTMPAATVRRRPPDRYWR